MQGFFSQKKKKGAEWLVSRETKHALAHAERKMRIEAQLKADISSVIGPNCTRPWENVLDTRWYIVHLTDRI